MQYYTYAYLREDRTPYYIGKGKGNRVHIKNKKDIKPPKDKSRILILKQNLTEQEAFRHEVYMIAVFGRKDLGTGILHNRTDGGEGCSGIIRTDEWKGKISKANRGKTRSEETKRKISEAKKNPPKETRRRLSESKKGENHPNYGKTFSEKTKKKLSIKKEKYNYIIFSITEDITYLTNNLKGFCKEHSLCRNHLSKTLIGKYKQHKGFVIIQKELIPLTLPELAQENCQTPVDAL